MFLLVYLLSHQALENFILCVWYYSYTKNAPEIMHCKQKAEVYLNSQLIRKLCP